jgi:hypothetical protein
MGKDKKGKDCHKTDKLAPMDNCASNSSLTKGTKKGEQVGVATAEACIILQ